MVTEHPIAETISQILPGIFFYSLISIFLFYFFAIIFKYYWYVSNLCVKKDSKLLTNAKILELILSMALFWILFFMFILDVHLDLSKFMQVFVLFSLIVDFVLVFITLLLWPATLNPELGGQFEIYILTLKFLLYELPFLTSLFTVFGSLLAFLIVYIRSINLLIWKSTSISPISARRSK